MADILNKIEAYKREEIARAEEARPLEQVEAAASAAPAVRPFADALSHKIADGKFALGAGDPAGVFITVPKGEGGNLKTVIERTDPLVAPLAKGQRVGTIKVTSAGGATLASLPLVVQQPVELAGIFGRAWDAMRLWLK